MTIIIFNYLIAELTRTYEENKARQSATCYKNMARILFEFEIWYRIFFRTNDQQRSITYFVLGEKKDRPAQAAVKQLPNLCGCRGTLEELAEEVRFLRERLEILGETGEARQAVAIDRKTSAATGLQASMEAKLDEILKRLDRQEKF
jgi:hypothetical protein